MKRILQCFSKQFSFESKEMKNFYYSSNKEVELKLLSIFQAMVTISFTLFTAVGIGVNVHWRETVIRSVLILGSIITFFVRKFRLNVYKTSLAVLVCGLTFYMTFFNIYTYKKSNIIQAFISGNGIGMLEMVFVISFKTPCFRFFAYTAVFIFKIFCFYEDLTFQPHIYAQFLFSVFQIFVFCLYYDILDRKNFGIIFKTSEKIKKFQDLLSNDLPSSVIVMSSDFGSILYSNKFFQQEFASDGSTEDTAKIINNLFGKLILYDEDSQSKKNHQQTSLLDYLLEIATQSLDIQDQEHVKKLYTSHKDEGGNEQHYEVRLRRIIWDAKPSYAIVMNDTTDKQLVTALRIADAQKDRVIATVSHELRTPINGIIGLLEMASELAYDKTIVNYLENCKSCSKLLLYLVNAILDLSQLRNNSLKIVRNNFNLTEMLEELKSLYLFQSNKKGIDFIIEKDPSVNEEIYTDRYRLVEVLINLLGNSMKFTFHGFVKLNISQSHNRRDCLIFSIEDTGLGIKEQDKNKLFKMFGKIEQTNKNVNTHGAGLGLTIANELVKALNAHHKDERIMFHSEYNKGSRFWFQLDITAPKTESIIINDNIQMNISSENLSSRDFLEFLEPSHVSYIPILKFDKVSQDNLQLGTNSFLTSKGKDILRFTKSNEDNLLRQVLLIDDNPLNLMAAGFILEKLKFSVTKAFNGQEGLQLLEESVRNQKQFCLVLSDIQMPIMDGLEMSKKIKEKIEKKELYSVPIVALTAQKLDQKEQEKYKEFGIAWSLEKPLVKGEIEKVINSLLK